MINSIAELKEEKHRIRQRRRELEGEISNNWHNLKDGLRPVNIIKDTINSIFNHKAEETRNNNDSVLKSALSFIATELAAKVSDKATDLFNSIFKKKDKSNQATREAEEVEVEPVEED